MSKFGQGNTRQGGRKLSLHDVQQIRHDFDTGRKTQGQLSREYGVSVVQIGRICRREVWHNVAPAEVTDTDLMQSAHRLMKLQEEVTQRSALQKMSEQIAADKDSGKAGDRMLDELMGKETGDGAGEG